MKTITITKNSSSVVTQMIDDSAKEDIFVRHPDPPYVRRGFSLTCLQESVDLTTSVPAFGAVTLII